LNLEKTKIKHTDYEMNGGIGTNFLGFWIYRKKVTIPEIPQGARHRFLPNPRRTVKKWEATWEIDVERAVKCAERIWSRWSKKQATADQLWAYFEGWKGYFKWSKECWIMSEMERIVLEMLGPDDQESKRRYYRGPNSGPPEEAA
jgi:hypothetical protein